MPGRSHIPLDRRAEALIAHFEAMTAQELRLLAEVTAASELTPASGHLPAFFLSAKTSIHEWAFYDLRLAKTRAITDATLRADAALEGEKRDQVALDSQMALVYAVTALMAKQVQLQDRQYLAELWDSYMAQSGHP